MTTDRESEIKSCLAYAVLDNPDPWIGCPSTVFLQAFLSGAAIRRDFVGSQLPDWRISGVLDDPAFYQQFVAATGHPTLSIRWATALAMTHLSLTEGFARLKNEALAWHRAHGVGGDDAVDVLQSAGKGVDRNPNVFWDHFASRQALYTGDHSGWTLYCFLNGMKIGGDWLALPEMPRLDEIFGGICARSMRWYGSPFAAFRVYAAQGLLELVGFPATADAT